MVVAFVGRVYGLVSDALEERGGWSLFLSVV